MRGRHRDRRVVFPCVFSSHFRQRECLRPSLLHTNDESIALVRLRVGVGLVRTACTDFIRHTGLQRAGERYTTCRRLVAGCYRGRGKHKEKGGLPSTMVSGPGHKGDFPMKI